MIDGINRLDDPTMHPFTSGCGDPERCYPCGYYEDEHKNKDRHNAHLGATEKA